MVFAAQGPLIPSALAVACTLAFTASAHAAPPSFAQAEAAWRDGMLEESQALYEQALTSGALVPREVVVARARVGTVKAALQDPTGALRDFRVVAVIDPTFELPADSGRVAAALHAQAVREAAELGGRLTLSLAVPQRTGAARPFTVRASLPAAWAPLLAEVVVTVEDVATGRVWRRGRPAAAQVAVTCPERLAVAGARLRVRARAVDASGNEWASAVQVLTVEDEPGAGALQVLEPLARPARAKPRAPSGPVPWLIAGGVLVAGGVVAAVAVRPQAVETGAPTWQ